MLSGNLWAVRKLKVPNLHVGEKNTNKMKRLTIMMAMIIFVIEGGFLMNRI
jgi:hypothetical protein